MGAVQLFRDTLLRSVSADGDRLFRRVLFIPAVCDRVAVITVAIVPAGRDPHDTPLARRAMPVWVPMEELVAALETDDLVACDEDPFYADMRPEHELSEFSRNSCERRWRAVEPIVSVLDPASVPAFLDPALRWELVQQVRDRTGCAADKVYDWLRIYCQRGQVRNALLSSHHRCGARGKPRKKGAKKLGRPSLLAQHDARFAGINVSDDVRQRLATGGMRFYVKMGLSLTAAYHRTLATLFKVGVEVRDGVAIPILPEQNDQPTIRQFVYWTRVARNLAAETQARAGERRWNLKHRPVLGTSEHLSQAPGELYIIDATVGDIHLVSSLVPGRLIGRPVIYLVIDHFSRMIVGFYVGLEGPSWVGAQMALHNTFSEKTAFCARYGREITSAEWPCQGMPLRMMFDRGREYLGKPSDQLVTTFQIDLESVPPYRPDFKSFVESQFRVNNEYGIHWQPGAVYQERDRGDPDYRLEAALTLPQFTRLMIDLILWNNLCRPIKGWIPEGVPLAEAGDPTPLDLWEWGMEHRATLMRQVLSDRIRVDLLPRSKASVTDHGIYVHDVRLHYRSDDPRIQGWFIRNTDEKHRPNLEVSFDRRAIGRCFLRLDGGRTLSELVLTAANQRYADMTLEEVRDYLSVKEIRRQKSRGTRAQSRVEIMSRMEEHGRRARAQLAEDIGPGERVKVIDINEARAAQKRATAAEEAVTATPPAPVPPPAVDDDDDYIPIPRV
ncbi:hypothetical protein [Longimicrobium sp.]|uniref:hypothetical protein n=1 Tax=Longimicrobium sp. TaxID=2029185 RepID=UPI003B3AE881